MNLKPNTKICRKMDLPFQDFDDFAVILSPKTNEIHELNGLGKFIWDEIAESSSVASVIEKVVEDFEVDAALAEKDTMAFLFRLSELNLVESSVE